MIVHVYVCLSELLKLKPRNGCQYTKCNMMLNLLDSKNIILLMSWLSSNPINSCSKLCFTRGKMLTENQILSIKHLMTNESRKNAKNKKSTSQKREGESYWAGNTWKVTVRFFSIWDLLFAFIWHFILHRDFNALYRAVVMSHFVCVIQDNAPVKAPEANMSVIL